MMEIIQRLVYNALITRFPKIEIYCVGLSAMNIHISIDVKTEVAYGYIIFYNDFIHFNGYITSWDYFVDQKFEYENPNSNLVEDICNCIAKEFPDVNG